MFEHMYFIHALKSRKLLLHNFIYIFSTFEIDIYSVQKVATVNALGVHLCSSSSSSSSNSSSSSSSSSSSVGF